MEALGFTNTDAVSMEISKGSPPTLRHPQERELAEGAPTERAGAGSDGALRVRVLGRVEPEQPGEDRALLVSLLDQGLLEKAAVAEQGGEVRRALQKTAGMRRGTGQRRGSGQAGAPLEVVLR